MELAPLNNHFGLSKHAFCVEHQKVNEIQPFFYLSLSLCSQMSKCPVDLGEAVTVVSHRLFPHKTCRLIEFDIGNQNRFNFSSVYIFRDSLSLFVVPFCSAPSIHTVSVAACVFGRFDLNKYSVQVHRVPYRIITLIRDKKNEREKKPSSVCVQREWNAYYMHWQKWKQFLTVKKILKPIQKP